MMLEWDGRLNNAQSVQILKAAIPFLDVSVGEKIDLEGLLGAVRPFSLGRERKIIDMFLQVFQMKHMMEMMQLMQAMQQTQEMGAESDGDTNPNQNGNMGAMELIRNMIPPEQQDTVEMMMSMMTAMQDSADSSDTGEQERKETDSESVDF